MSFSVVITPAGIIAPTFADIVEELKADFRTIFGNDIYLEDDSQDGQMLSIFATAMKNNNDAIIAAYNSFSPATAQGAGLSNVVKINGIQRLVSSNSMAVVTVVGQVGTSIQQGQIADSAGIRWTLPVQVIIPDAGQIDVTATAVDPGAVLASANTLNVIVTPVRGWQSVNNIDAASPGAPVETDAELRQRQSQSTAIPALSVTDAIQGAVKNTIGVGRVVVYENDTGAADANGIPAHSISVVVQGGDAQTIATTIQRYKTPGTGTYGSTTETVNDGIVPPININFFVLSLIQISVLVFATAEAGYVNTTATLIANTLAEWFNNFAIGQDSLISKLWSPINLTGDAATDATGMTQLQLDALSNTYNATAIYQAREDMDVIDGPYNAGATVIQVANTGNYENGSVVAMKLDDGSWHRTSVNGVPVGTAVTLLNAIPAGRTLQNDTLVYVSDSLVIEFNEATAGIGTSMTIEVA